MQVKVKELVFCNRCVYYQSYADRCLKNPVASLDPIKGTTFSYRRCEEKNKNFNCKDYQKNLKNMLLDVLICKKK